MNMGFRPLAGRRGLFLGAGTDHAAAWRCARHVESLGARVLWSDAVSSPAGACMELAGLPLAARMPGGPPHCASLRDAVDQAARQLGGFDFVVHTMLDPPVDMADELTQVSTEEFARATRIYCLQFAELARYCAPHMPSGGALVSLHLGHDDANAAQSPVQALHKSIHRLLALEMESWAIRVHCTSMGTLRPGEARTTRLGPHGRALEALFHHVASLVGPAPATAPGQMLRVAA